MARESNYTPTATNSLIVKMVLPRFITIKSVYNHKYLLFREGNITDENGVQMHGLLEFAGDSASPFTSFQIEPARCGNGLVHIKNCHNNKYFVRWSSTHWWMAAIADAPLENSSQWNCTLFRPIQNSQDNTIQFVHVQLGHYICLWRAAAPFTNYLFAGAPTPDKDRCDVYTITDLSITIKSVYNQKLLYFKEGNITDEFGVNMHGLLEFAGDNASPLTSFVIEPARCGNGLVHIRSCYNGKYFVRWSSTHWWIAATAEQSWEDSSQWNCTLFRPIKNSQDNTIQFVHVQLGHYLCLWRAAAPFTNYLFAGTATPDKDRCDVFTITQVGA
ncbi:hypothetical protein OROGR_008151 [Orobanche gracilis]